MRKPMTATVYYDVDHDTNTAFWLLDYPGDETPERYSANRTASFYGWNLAAGPQCHGWASTPLMTSDARAYFRRWLADIVANMGESERMNISVKKRTRNQLFDMYADALRELSLAKVA